MHREFACWGEPHFCLWHMVLWHCLDFSLWPKNSVVSYALALLEECLKLWGHLQISACLKEVACQHLALGSSSRFRSRWAPKDRWRPSHGAPSPQPGQHLGLLAAVSSGGFQAAICPCALTSYFSAAFPILVSHFTGRWERTCCGPVDPRQYDSSKGQLH